MNQHKARKRFGQNFLTDQAIIERIVLSIQPQTHDKLVEIGPGLGALTCPLIDITGALDVIELDRDIIPKLQLNCGLKGQLSIHNVDVLNFDFATLLTSNSEKLRIVGNLPYNISTPIIFHLAEHAGIIKDMYFMLQKEVVERLSARAGDSDYSRLSVMSQYYFKITPLFLVPAEAFSPRPKVESAIVRLLPHATPPVEVGEYAFFASLVKQAFSQRRKTLRNVLKNMATAAQLEQAGIEPGHRAQELNLEQFANLSRLLQQQ